MFLIAKRFKNSYCNVTSVWHFSPRTYLQDISLPTKDTRLLKQKFENWH